jgi:hypothetical protein
VDPIQIRLYGLITVTRSGYILRLVLGLVLAVGLIVMRFALPLPSELSEGLREHRGVAIAHWLLLNLQWIVLGALLLGALEAFFVLRRFKREEAARRTPIAETNPAPQP